MRSSDGGLNGPAGRSREHPVDQQLFRGTTAAKTTSAKVREEPAIATRLLAHLDDAPDVDAVDAGPSARLDLKDRPPFGR